MADTLYYATKFAIGTYDQIEPAIKEGTLSYPAYVYVSDEKQLAFINKDLSVDIVRGAAQVLRVDDLPPIEDGDQDVLYIWDNNVYVFTGEAYRPMYSDVSEEVLTEVIELKEKVDALDDEIKSLAQVVENISNGSSGLIFDEYENFPNVGISNQLYIATDENRIYRYDEGAEEYVVLSKEDFETAQDIPITVLDGTEEDVVVLMEQESGTYFVTGYYKITEEDDEPNNASSPILFLVDKDTDGIFVTEFGADGIKLYSLTDYGATEDFYATREYLEDYVQEITESYATQEYVQNCVQEYVDEAIYGAMKERY